MGEKSARSRRDRSRSPRRERSRRDDSRDRSRRDDRSRERSPRRDGKHREKRKHSSRRHSRSRSRSSKRHSRTSSRRDEKEKTALSPSKKEPKESEVVSISDVPPAVVAQPKESVKGSLADLFNLPDAVHPAAATTTSASKGSVKGMISDIFRVVESPPTNKSLSKSATISLPSVLGARKALHEVLEVDVDMEIDTPPPPSVTLQKPPPPPLPSAATGVAKPRPPPPPPAASVWVDVVVQKPPPPPLPTAVTKKPPPPPITVIKPTPPPSQSVPAVAVVAPPSPAAATSLSVQSPPVTAMSQDDQPLPSPVIAPPSPLAKPPVVDVGSIKMDILKALAQAKSSLAKKVDGVPTKTAESTVEAEKVGDEDGEEEGEMLELRKSNKSKPQVTDEAKQEPLSPQPPTASSSPAAAPQEVNVAAKTADGDDYDMFALDDDDDDENAKNVDGGTAAPVFLPAGGLEALGNHDDSEGYYRASIGEVLNGEYRVVGTMGKGVFSTVLLCKTTIDGQEKTVAVKLIRNNDTMRDAAQLEVRLLNELQSGPRKSKYVIRMLASFEYRNHAAMVFEPMQMNVREAMKKFGGRDGLALRGVKVFSRQLMLALDHLQKCNIVHADIKPDNMLLDDKQSMVKLCDFGSAFKMGAGEVHDPTPYLVSRYYRAPEVILGLPYDHAVDMWSVGCCIYEMFTGKVMFPGQTNNEMLKLFMELKGRLPPKLVRRHRQIYMEKFLMEPHFDDGLRFCSREIDRVTGTPLVRMLSNVTATRDLNAALLAAKSQSDEKKMVLDLKDLLDKIFHVDPAKRITVEDALKHPFVRA
ncbi:Aste57867_18611 [Aphanomyces stellatus]|uniref:non-specific serine/threonine protein kinase n=1 Tax=Aphanomyces stellatus TaxID=120398 RepID=A0A485LBF0_9STRA|nr:hypothetical protein As57867_018549 [Aphanomyces stellatus]VFT95346.1 Aste57867_18611 [Aphanomyces stellatus]